MDENTFTSHKFEVGLTYFMQTHHRSLALHLSSLKRELILGDIRKCEQNLLYRNMSPLPVHFTVRIGWWVTPD